MIAGISRGSPQSLSDVVSSGKPLAPDEAVGILFELIRRVADLHAGNQLHLQIVLAAISVGPEGVSLAAAQTTASLEFLRELLNWPVTERLRLPRELPTDLADARRVLEAAGISADPRSFDLLALGDVFCRLLTTKPSADYRQSLRIKGMVPAALQPLLERMLGTDGQLPFDDAPSLLNYLEKLRPESSSEPRSDSQLTEAYPPTPVTSTSDTALTGISPGRKPDDTTVEPALRSDPPEPGDALPFGRLGHFEIQARIGHGGMGDVYRGYERSLNRTVAIKVLPAEFSRQADFVRRFQAEATAAARLVHPNIIQIYFIGEDAGHHFFAMQYVDGLSLAMLLEQQSKLYVNTAVSLIEQILHGLEEAHALGFVHRDIKPGNILIDRAKQRALLADFGLVKESHGSKTSMTATGVILGTVDYISPEQARGKDVDGRSDLYSVGVLMYRILSGELPFKADSATALIFQHVYEQPRPLIDVAPHVPDPLAAIVAKLMQKNPDDRYRSSRTSSAISRLTGATNRCRSRRPRAASRRKSPAWTI